MTDSVRQLELFRATCGWIRGILRLPTTLGLVLIIVTGCVGNSYDPARENARIPSPAPGRYIIIGDSIMDTSSGTESTTTASLILLEENISVVNISLSGQTMAGPNGAAGSLNSNVSGAVNYLSPTNQLFGVNTGGVAVIIQLGHNDWYMGISKKTFLDRYKKFLESIVRRGGLVRVYCVVPIPAKWDFNGHQNNDGLSLESWREGIRGLGESGACETVDTTDWFAPSQVSDTNIYHDGLHLAPGGHRIFKNRLMEAVGSRPFVDSEQAL